MNEVITLTEKQQTLIEKTGVLYEQVGFSPAAARILALLLISDKIELTFDQIRNTLYLSKSATSNGVNFLLQTKQIEYITKMGDRKRYFRSLVTIWKEKVQESLQNTFQFSKLFKEILDCRTKSTLDFNKSLEEVILFMNYMEKELPKLVENWEKENK